MPTHNPSDYSIERLWDYTRCVNQPNSTIDDQGQRKASLTLGGDEPIRTALSIYQLRSAGMPTRLEMTLRHLPIAHDTIFLEHKIEAPLLLGLTHCQQANPSDCPSNPIAGRRGGTKQHATHHRPEHQLPAHHRHARSFRRKPPRLEATTSTGQKDQSGVNAAYIQVKRTSALLVAKPPLRIARRTGPPSCYNFYARCYIGAGALTWPRHPWS